MRERCWDPYDPERLQDPPQDILSGDRREIYLSIGRSMRENSFTKCQYIRTDMERVYDLLNTCDPVFYAPHFRESLDRVYVYDPIVEFQPVYRHFLLSIHDLTDMDDADVAGSISRNTEKIVSIFEKNFKELLEPYCLAKGIQYYCNIFGIRCSLIDAGNGVMYALSEIDEEQTDRFGLVRTENRLNDVVGAVTDYLEKRQYEYEILNTTFMSRTITIQSEGTAFHFSYRDYFDNCLVRVILRRSLRDRFGEDVYFYDSAEGKNIIWEKEFSLTEGTDGLMKGIEQFLPEGGMPEQVSAQVDVMRKTVSAAEEAYAGDDQEELNALINRAGDENEELDRLCEQYGFPYEYVGNVPYRFYTLLKEMGLFNEEGEDGQEETE